MDGLLLDTERLYAVAMKHEAAELGMSVSDDVLNTMVGASWASCFELMMEIHGSNFDTEAYRVGVFRRFYELVDTELNLKSGVVETLDELDRLDIPKAICTSSRREDAEHHLVRTGIAGRFNAIVAFGDYVQSKPNPEPYLRCAEILNVDPSSCLALEDSHNGVRAAAAAGMMTVMVPDLLEATDEMHDLCVGVASDLHVVRKRLAQICDATSPHPR